MKKSYQTIFIKQKALTYARAPALIKISYRLTYQPKPIYHVPLETIPQTKLHLVSGSKEIL